MAARRDRGVCGARPVPLDGVVAVDTGSKDESADLLLDAFDEVVTVSGRTAYPEAVRIGLEQVPADAAEWVWLLHDDSNPAPDALERLLAAAAADPDADVLGPKLREWPSLKRLLEVGVTISGTGRRETGLEPGEYDQGQHDEVRQVLAVNTAGMLVRREVLRPARRPRRQPPDVRQRPRLRLARGRGRRPDGRGARRPSSSTPRPRTAASGVRR